jgi:hypothetical protein
MILSIYTTGRHGILALNPNKILWTRAVLKVLVVSNVETNSSKIGSILCKKSLHMGILVRPLAARSPILAIQLTLLARHGLSASRVFTVSELAVSSVVPG